MKPKAKPLPKKLPKAMLQPAMKEKADSLKKPLPGSKKTPR